MEAAECNPILNECPEISVGLIPTLETRVHTWHMNTEVDMGCMGKGRSELSGGRWCVRESRSSKTAMGHHALHVG